MNQSGIDLAENPQGWRTNGVLEQGRIISDEWFDQYNRFHPHQSLGGLAPATFARPVKITEV